MKQQKKKRKSSELPSRFISTLALEVITLELVKLKH